MENYRLKRTEEQFALRQRLAHSISLWHALHHDCKPLFTSKDRAYNRFRSLAAKLPPVYFTLHENACGAALLIPGTPVSSGPLRDIVYRLGEAGGSPALLTDLTDDDFGREATILLVALRQRVVNNIPRLETEVREVEAGEFSVSGDGLALAGDAYADTERGWALVRMSRSYSVSAQRFNVRCSTQTVVTQCTLYRQYQTDEALVAAADSYGGLTG